MSPAYQRPWDRRDFERRIQSGGVRRWIETYPAELRLRVERCLRSVHKGQQPRSCGLSLCPNCHAAEGHRRAARHLSIFARHAPPGAAPRIAHEVYTLPPDLRWRVRSPAGLAAFRRAVRAVVLRVHGPDAAFIANLHDVGDVPTVFHPHLDVVVHGYGRDGARRRAARVSFDELRAIYGTALRAELGAFEGDPVLWFDRRGGVYTQQPRRVAHVIRYSCRRPFDPAGMLVREDGSASYQATANGPRVAVSHRAVLDVVLANARDLRGARWSSPAGFPRAKRSVTA